MNNSVEVCSGRLGCYNEIIYACICGDPVAFICKDCMHVHLSEPSTHTLISLDQARELISNRISLKDFNQNVSKYTDIKAEIQSYLRRIKQFKQEIETFKHQAILKIEQKSQAAIDFLTLNQEKAEAQLSTFKNQMKNFTTTNDNLLAKFEARGISGIILDYQEKLEINKTQIFAAIDIMITMSNSPSQPLNIPEESKQQPISIPIPTVSSSILFAKHGTKKLVRYDPLTNQTLEYSLATSVTKQFEFTSTCILPDGNIMIIGGAYHGDTYRFNPTNGECLMLSSLNNPRKCVGVFCHNDGYIYAYGGYITSVSNKAERMEWNGNGNGWENLPNMNHPRSLPGRWYNDYKLYLFGGKDCCSVEYYDFMKNTFNLVPELKVPQGESVVGFMDDKIYILNKHLTVVSKDLDIIEDKKNISSVDFWNLSDVTTRGKSFIFYCGNYNIISSLNTESKVLRPIMSI